MNRKLQVAKNHLKILFWAGPLISILISALLPDLPSSPSLKECFWANKIKAEKRYDIVYAGDSRVYRGINPRVIDSVMGDIQSFNFGFSSAGLDTAYIQHAVSLLKSDGKRLLVLGFSPNAFVGSSLKNLHYNSWLCKDDMDIWIKKHIFPFLEPFDPRTFSDLYKFMKGEAYNENFFMGTGFVASDKKPFEPQSAIEAYKKQFSRKKPFIPGSFFLFLKRIQAEGVKIMFTRIPVGKEMKQLEDRICTKFIDEFYLNCRLAEIDVYDFSAMDVKSYDGSHLSSADANVFSVKLAGFIRKL